MFLEDPTGHRSPSVGWLHTGNINAELLSLQQFLICSEAENFRSFKPNKVIHRKCTYHWDEVAAGQFSLCGKSDT